jgi:hypothetical protein
MFQLVIAFFLTANGVVADEPVGQMKKRTLFPSQEACLNYYGTAEGTEEKAIVDKFAASKSAIVKFSCEKDEDNSI